MDIESLVQAGLSEIQAKIYLYLIEHGQSTPTEVANGIRENRTTVYSAAEKLEALGIISQKDRGKISAYVPNHPSVLESLAEKRLRKAARQAKNLEANLPSLINYYNEHQDQPGVTTFYGKEGTKIIRNKILAEGQPFYYVRSRFDEKADPEGLEEFKKARTKTGITTESITAADSTRRTNAEAAKELVVRTLLPSNEYDSPIQIGIFGNNVTFINYAKDGMSTLIESAEIADAMRQFYLLAKKYIQKGTDQEALSQSVQDRLNRERSGQA